VVPVLPVPKSDLGHLEFINEGKFGRVYRTAYTLHSVDPAELASPTALVYKEYLDAGSRARSAARAERAVKFRDDLFYDKAARAVLDAYFAWPREVVEDDLTGETCGFLMALAPDAYFWQLWRQGGYVRVPRTLDWVTTTERLWQMSRVDLSDVIPTDRLFLMAQLVYAIGWLHNRGWAFGDLSFTNVAFAMFPNPPQPLIFDCDDAVELADLNRGNQPHTPFWVPPECIVDPLAPQDAVTDVYKLGLAIVRCLKPGDGATLTNDVGRLADILDDDGIALLKRALSDDRPDRPTAKELYVYLERIATSRMVPPKIGHAELVTSLLPSGGNARIYWQIDGAEEVNVYFGDPKEKVRFGPLADPPDECAFPVTRTGQVTVEAKNRYGTTTRVIGDVALFEIPQFSLDPLALPRPDVPPVPAYTATPLPDLPAGHPGAPDIPSMPKPAFIEALRELAPGTALSSPAQRINVALDTSRTVLDMLQVENERFATRLRRKKSNKIGSGNGQALSAGAPWRRGPQAAGGRGVRQRNRRAHQARRHGRRAAHDRGCRHRIDVLRSPSRRRRRCGLVDSPGIRLGRGDHQH
jgi:serine/threonine protein kinase